MLLEVLSLSTLPSMSTMSESNGANYVDIRGIMEIRTENEMDPTAK